MAPITFGYAVSFPYSLPQPRFILRLAERAEELGFDSIAVGDHLVTNRPYLEVLTVLTIFAARTSRIKLVTDALQLPLHNPAVLAKRIASLDYLSAGRTIVGVGVGGDYPKDFELCGVPLSERGRRADEALVVLRQLWTKSSASHAGNFWQFEDAGIDPKPAQPQGPPILIAGRSDKALQRAVRFGDGWLPYLMSPERFESSVEKIRITATALQRDLTGFQLVHHQHIFAASNREQARDQAISYLSWTFRRPFQELAEKFCAMGTVEDCVRRIERFARAGVRHVILEPACDTDQILDQLGIYAKEVLPHFKHWD